MGKAGCDDLPMKLLMSLVAAGRVIECEPKRSQPGAFQHALKRMSRSSEFDKVAELYAIAEKRQARHNVVPVGRRGNDQPLVTTGHTERRETDRHRLGLRRRRHARPRVIHHVRHVLRRMTQLTCRGRIGALWSRKAYMRPRADAAPGAAC